MTWYVAPAPRRRLPLWAKAIITVLVVGTAGMVLFVAAVAVSLSGGIDDVLDWRKPTRDSDHVVRARAAAVAALPGRVRDLTSAVPGSTGIRSADDGCSVGQHNWKIDDSYDLDCVARLSVVWQGPGGAAGPVDAGAAAVADAVGAQLDAAWAPAPSSYGDTARWTTGPEETAGVLEVVVAPLEPGSPLGREALAAGARVPLVLVTVSERYVYE